MTSDDDDREKGWFWSLITGILEFMGSILPW
jgi:hypothetical protein